MTGCGTNTDLNALPSCQVMLADGIGAYLQLITGGQAVEVKYRDQSVKYTPATAAMLKQHLINLHQTCGNAETAAILGLNRTRQAASTSFGNCSPRRCC